LNLQPLPSRARDQQVPARPLSAHFDLPNHLKLRRVALPLVQSPSKDLRSQPACAANPRQSAGRGGSANGVRTSPPLLAAPAPLALWHLCSFDAPTVAVVWAFAFAWAAGVQLRLSTPVLLALAAWSVYIGDRLLDARAGLRSPDWRQLPAHRQLQDRHYFHWRRRYILAPLAACAALAAACIALASMPRTARVPDSFLTAAALAYFSGVHSHRRLPRPLPRLFTKELLVGVIFTAACALPAYLRLRGRGGALWAVVVPAIYFAALAWLNCHAIAHWERADAWPHPRAAGRALRVDRLGTILGLAGATLALALFAGHPRPSALLAAGAASALLLAVLDRSRGRLTPLALRALADLVLLTPIFFLPR